jgi:homoserine kinase
LTLSLFLTLDVQLSSSEQRTPPNITVSGEGAGEAPLDPYKNLITRVALYVLRCHSISYFPSALSIHVHNEIPFGRGLGSSGAAVIAGVLLADAVGNLNLSPGRRLDFALMVERHPDNVAAALLGGFVGSYLRELSPEETNATQIPLAEVLPEYPPDASEEWGKDPPVPPEGIGHFVRFGWANEIKAVAIIPRFELSTAKARDALQASYPLKDCVRPRRRGRIGLTFVRRSSICSAWRS